MITGLLKLKLAEMKEPHTIVEGTVTPPSLTRIEEQQWSENGKSTCHFDKTPPSSLCDPNLNLMDVFISIYVVSSMGMEKSAEGNTLTVEYGMIDNCEY